MFIKAGSIGPAGGPRKGAESEVDEATVDVSLAIAASGIVAARALSPAGRGLLIVAT
jgi:hypothetical protein